MKPRHLFYTAVLLFAGTHNGTLLAQEMPKVIPPSPEVGTILQHSPINVSLYTGTPNISVPFHTISHGGVEVPVSLSYSTDGIRVENIASWAGLGWSLNAGGLISRTINKLPDDSSIGYMNTTYTMADFLTRGEGTGVGTRQHELWTYLGDGEYRDYEPDIFNFSFLGYSGQFYYNREQNEFNQAPLSNLRIETTKSAGIIIGFIITDEAGIKYYFGKSKDGNRTARELLKDARTKSHTTDGIFEGSQPFSMGAMNCYQSWMLMDIVFPTSSEMIRFFYSTEENVETYILMGEEFVKGYAVGGHGNITNYLKKQFDQPKLDTIAFPTGKVIFEKETTERLDLDNSYALKRMLLLDKKNNIVKKMQMHTSYMVSEPEDLTLFFADEERGRHRLRLDSLSLQASGTSTANQGRYVFKYNPLKLPNRYSNSIDYFGYYNGRQNTSLLPKTFFVPPIDPNQRLIAVGSANRSVYPNYTQASVLQQIVYPTGGYDEFIWENNTISSFSGDNSSYRDNLIDNYVNSNTNNNNSNYTPDTIDPPFYFTNDAALPGITLEGSIYKKNMTIPQNVRGGIEFSASMTGCSPPDFNQVDCHFDLRIKGITNPDFLLIIHQASFYMDPLELPAGDYQVLAKSLVPIVDPNQQTGSGPFPQVTLLVKWSYDPNPSEWTYSGLRIKEVKTFDKQASKAFSKEYDYRYLEPDGITYKSSGRAINFIDVLDDDYYVTEVVETGADLGEGPVYMYFSGEGYKLTSGSQVPMVATKGSLVGYPNVTETFNGGLNGYNKYAYSFIDKYNPEITLQQDVFAGGNPSPVPINYAENFKQRVYCDWLRGNIEQVETYDRQHVKLNSKLYEYEVANSLPIPYFGIETRSNDPYEGISPCPCDNMMAEFFSTVTEHHRLKKLTEKNYFGGNEVTVLKEYSYNTLSQLSQERSFDNNQLDATTKYFYPSDDSMSAKPCVAQLIAQNRIGAPLVTQTYKVNEKLSEQETVYKDWGSGLIAPEIIQTSKGTAAPEPRVKYLLLNTGNGVPLEVQQAEGTRICYIWGHNYTQPVAKIENIAYASIPTSLINAVENASNAVPYVEANLLTALTNLRTDPALANAMVTTYTYKPLVGISTITDPSGDKATYHYDSFNRLQFVKDRDGNILSENQYHYRTQN